MERIDKINEELKRVISEVLRELKDPRFNNLTSITSVDATKDLKEAIVYVSVYGDEIKQKEEMEAIQKAKGHIRHEIGGKMELRYIPELRFILDKSIETGAKIEEILEGLKIDEKK